MARVAGRLTAGAQELRAARSSWRRPSWRVTAMVVLASALAATALSVLANPGILERRFPDPDDYLRLALTGNWLDGGGWWNMSLPRLNPPGGMLAHWSRFTDLPIAALILPLEPWLGRAEATYIAALLVPPLLLIGFLCAVLRLARPLLGRRLALLAVPISVLSIYVRFDFAPGHVDHHNWHLLLAAVALGALLRLALHPGDRRDAVIAALAFALAMWIGDETLPWVAAANLAFCVIWVVQGRPVLGAAVRFAALLWGFCLLLLPLAHAPDSPWTVTCDSFGVYVATLPGFMFAYWAALLAIGRHVRGFAGRAAAAVGCAVLAGAALMLAFPECRAGPFSQLDPRLLPVLMDHNHEIVSARRFFGSGLQAVLVFLGPVAGAAFAVGQAFRSPGRARSAWLLFAVFAVTALVIGYLHVMVLVPAELFGLVPLVGLLKTIERRLGGWRRLVSAPTTVAAFAVLIYIVLPYANSATVLQAAERSKPQAGATPNAKEGGGQNCDLIAAAAVLNDPAGLGAARRLIAAPINDGSELLFRTRHDLLAAPYHRDVEGNLDVFNFFSAQQESTARAIAIRRRINLVLFCPSALGMWLPPAEGGPNFFEQLTAGQIPFWLRPVPLSPHSGVRLYQVVGLPR